MRLNVFDTETTGLPLFRQPSEHPEQPHLVEIAALLHDADGTLVDSFDAIIKPDGWKISEEVSKIHGITHEMAMDTGIPEREAVERYLALHDRAQLSVAHNHQFDARILRIALMRYFPERAEGYAAAPAFCTCEAAKPVMKLPPTPKMVRAGFRSYKTPNLTEAVHFYLGEYYEGAHRARNDAEACARIYFAMQRQTAEVAA
jgi:DNA polymerase III epsilon subunit-like protein